MNDNTISGYNHSTLLLNNNYRGPSGDTNVIVDYSNLEEDVGRAWFLPQHGQHTQAGNVDSTDSTHKQVM